MKTKHCSKCDTHKPREEFHVNRRSKDGRNNWCKPCMCAHVRSARKANPEFYRAYDRERSKRPERKAADYQYTLKKRARNPARTRAHWAVDNALRSGRLVKEPCSVCGGAPADAHHDDYSKPLDVRWLCRRHHVDHHTHAR